MLNGHEQTRQQNARLTRCCRSCECDGAWAHSALPVRCPFLHLLSSLGSTTQPLRERLLATRRGNSGTRSRWRRPHRCFAMAVVSSAEGKHEGGHDTTASIPTTRAASQPLSPLGPLHFASDACASRAVAVRSSPVCCCSLCLRCCALVRRCACAGNSGLGVPLSRICRPHATLVACCVCTEFHPPPR